MKLNILIGIAGLLLCASAYAGDLKRGEALVAEKGCVACHGADGNGNGDPQYPILAGQYADYLERSLNEYKSGARANVIMAGFVATLEPRDIKDLSAWFASQSSKLSDLKGMD